MKIKRLYNDMVSIRDYIVDSCIEKDESILVKVKDAQMLLTPEDLKKGVRGTERYISKYDERVYSLVDFEWTTPTQEGLFNGCSALHPHINSISGRGTN